MEKKSVNKIIKMIGNLVMVTAIVFIIRRLLQNDIDFTIITKGCNGLILLGLVVAYAVGVVVCSVPWRNTVYLMTGEKINFVDAAVVSTKANVLKYIPGNVLQYVGRNELAIACGLKHADVALSTLADVVINLGTVFLVTLFFAFDTVQAWFQEHVSMKRLVWVGVAIIAVVLIVGIVIIFFYNKMRNDSRKKGRDKDTSKRICGLKGLANIVLSVCVYAGLAIYNTTIYMFVMRVAAGDAFDMGQVLYVAGAILASWILGFITPGAPGGLGIRETILVVFLRGMMGEQAILLGVVVNRVVSIFGDVSAMVIMQIINKCRRGGCNE